MAPLGVADLCGPAARAVKQGAVLRSRNDWRQPPATQPERGAHGELRAENWQKGPANLYGLIRRNGRKRFAGRTLNGSEGEAASNCASAVTDCRSAAQAWAKPARPGG